MLYQDISTNVQCNYYDIVFFWLVGLFCTYSRAGWPLGAVCCSVTLNEEEQADISTRTRMLQ